MAKKKAPVAVPTVPEAEPASPKVMNVVKNKKPVSQGTKAMAMCFTLFGLSFLVAIAAILAVRFKVDLPDWRGLLR
jgi:hypothetical protein